MISMKYFTEIN